MKRKKEDQLEIRDFNQLRNLIKIKKASTMLGWYPTAILAGIATAKERVVYLRT
jgi:hypothetical protein